MIHPDEWTNLFGLAKDATLSLTSGDGSKLSIKTTGAPVPKMNEAPPKPVESPVNTSRVMEDMNPQDPRYGMMMQSMVPPIESRAVPMYDGNTMMSGRNEARTGTVPTVSETVPPMETSPAAQRNAGFNVKATQANLEAAEATLAELEGRKAQGLPVNEQTLEGARRAVMHQQEQVADAMVRAGQSPAQTGTSQVEDETLRGADDNISVEGRNSVTVGGDTYTVDQKTGTLVNKQGNPINFDQNLVKEAGAFGFEQLGFKKQDLGRFLLYAAGGMLFGGSRNGSLSWAARKVLQESDARKQQEQQDVNQMRQFLISNKDKYSREDIERILGVTKEGGIGAGWDAIIGTPTRLTPDQVRQQNEAAQKAKGSLQTRLDDMFTSVSFVEDNGRRRAVPITYGPENRTLSKERATDAYLRFLESRGISSAQGWGSSLHSSIFEVGLNNAKNDPTFNGDLKPYFDAEFQKTTVGDLGAGATAEDYTLITQKAVGYANAHDADPLTIMKESDAMFGLLTDDNKGNFGERGKVAFINLTMNGDRAKRQQFVDYLRKNKDKRITIDEVRTFFNS